MLNGRMNEEGDLYIQRAGEYKHQVCPFSSLVKCGDSCPLFGEPRKDHRFSTSLQICKLTLHFDNFEDKREGVSPWINNDSIGIK